LRSSSALPQQLLDSTSLQSDFLTEADFQLSLRVNFASQVDGVQLSQPLVRGTAQGRLFAFHQPL
jgi:hypothetical protein